jgi:hypothetical protein
MPRFVILEHDFPHLHWDLMFECGPVLRTWRLAEPPVPGKAIAAEALGDHRLHYLDYEGPVSGNRGQVRRWAGGDYTTVAEEADRWELVLYAEQVNGPAQLIRSETGGWQLILGPAS